MEEAQPARRGGSRERRVVQTIVAPEDDCGHPRLASVVRSKEGGLIVAVVIGDADAVPLDRSQLGFEGTYVRGPARRVSVEIYEQHLTYWGPFSRGAIEREAEAICEEEPGGSLADWARHPIFDRCHGTERGLAAALWLVWRRHLAVLQVRTAGGHLAQIGQYVLSCRESGAVTFTDCENAAKAAKRIADLTAREGPARSLADATPKG